MTFLSKILGRRSSAKAVEVPPHEVEEPFFAVGDIHGRMDMLVRLTDLIAKDRLARPEMTNAPIVYVGDYVDRGDHSADILRHLYELNSEKPAQHICLMGNHEVMMLDALDDPIGKGGRWLRYGGMQTLASFGIGGVRERMEPDDLEHVMAQLQDALPDGLQAWMRGLPRTYRSGNVVVVHAALNPGRPWDDQSDRTRLWGHKDFFSRPHKDGLWVVHGHTIMDEGAVIAEGRMSIDTGAYATGKLTAVGLAGQEAWLLQT